MKSTLYTHTVFSTGPGPEKKRYAENTECDAGLDAAVAYRLALEKGTLGARYHVIAEEDVPFKDIADMIGRCLNLHVASKTAAEANENFNWFAMCAGMDAPASSQRTRELLGWKPKQPALIADIDHAAYFDG